MLIEKIGNAAMLEQTAEECVELAQACMKYARYIRNENPTTKSFNDILANLEEETADVCICLMELSRQSLISDNNVNKWMEIKEQRVMKRFKDE